MRRAVAVIGIDLTDCADGTFDGMYETQIEYLDVISIPYVADVMPPLAPST